MNEYLQRISDLEQQVGFLGGVVSVGMGFDTMIEGGAVRAQLKAKPLRSLRLGQVSFVHPPVGHLTITKDNRPPLTYFRIILVWVMPIKPRIPLIVLVSHRFLEHLYNVVSFHNLILSLVLSAGDGGAGFSQ